MEEIKVEEIRKPITRMTPSELFDEMNEYQKDMIYRMVKADFISEDTKYRIDDFGLEMSDEEKENLAIDVANRWVYDGKYDCDLSYWDNIDNLLRRCGIDI